MSEEEQYQNGNSWIGSSSRNTWIKELEDFCASDDLSIDELRKILSLPYDLEGSSCIHRVCMNKNVTLEIVECLLDLYPQALYSNMNMKIDEQTVTTSAYPLHLACCNKDCPNEVIKLLLKKEHDQQLMHMCYTGFDWGKTGLGRNTYGGTPLHYYLSRISNIDIDIVKQLSSIKRALLSHDGESKCAPIHILMHNKSIGDLYEVVKYLSEMNPSSLRKTDIYNQSPLHVACNNEHITKETIQFLLDACAGLVIERNMFSELPLHVLCWKKVMDNEVAIDVLKLLLEACPDSISVQTSPDLDDGDLPLHKAARVKSKAFCKVLVDAYPESVRRENGYGALPFHHACKNGCPETVEYLFKLHPESLHIRSDGGCLPIHWASDKTGENTAGIVNFLLLQDPDCLSKPSSTGDLPLHIVCPRWDTSNVTELLFDLYPEAILIRNGQGQLPADVNREINVSSISRSNKEYAERLQEVAIFLSTQEMYACKSQDQNAMRTPDFTGSLPLHNALYASAPLGSIKLLVKGNPDAVNVPDGSGRHPLDTACWNCTAGIVKYLAELLPDRLNTCDVNNNYPLHHACRGGNCEVISYLLENPVS